MAAYNKESLIFDYGNGKPKITYYNNEDDITNDATNVKQRQDTPQIQHSSTAKIQPPSKIQQQQSSLSTESTESSSIHFPNIHYLQLRHEQNYNWAEERLQKGVEYAKVLCVIGSDKRSYRCGGRNASVP